MGIKPDIYIVKVIAENFSLYTYLYKLDGYCYWLCNNMLGLGSIHNRKEIILVAWLYSINKSTVGYHNDPNLQLLDLQ